MLVLIRKPQLCVLSLQKKVNLQTKKNMMLLGPRYVQMCGCIGVHAQVYVCVHVGVCRCSCMCVDIWVCGCTGVYVHVYVCRCSCTCVCMGVCMNGCALCVCV